MVDDPHGGPNVTPPTPKNDNAILFAVVGLAILIGLLLVGGCSVLLLRVAG